jgi:hypothetical protein
MAGLLAAATIGVAAQAPKLDEVVRRMGSYLEVYEGRLALVVGEERYLQNFEVRGTEGPAVTVDRTESVLPVGSARMILRSDYALTRAPDKDAWVGYRDTFEVNGKPIRDREARLERLLTAGNSASAARIAEESSRFNLANSIVTRNINVPTLVLEMLHPRNQRRFTFSKGSEEMIGRVRTWRLDYKERERPTFIRDSNRRDRASQGSVWVDPTNGEVWRTLLRWDSDPRGVITVTYGHVANIDPVVPLTMSERYTPGHASLTGDATYTNYRQFQTGARLITNP